jgi:CheY-like chemotaxis protein
VRTDVAAGVPEHVLVDGRHLRQVLFNLMGNAVKFTPAGEVRLTVDTEGRDGLRFAVADTGMGIEPESLGRIFDAFGQTSAGAAAGGTGLGLTISRRLVRSMGGDLTVESTPGVGSTFSFTIQAAPVARWSAASSGDLVPGIDARLPAGDHITALVADDNTVNRRVLASLLASAGIRVITASGGRDAVDLAVRVRPDVVLMDWRMNDLDGFEATRLIHASGAAAMPVIAVTASAFGEVREAARAAGCIDFIPKPIRADVLFAKLQHHLGIRFESARGGRPAAADLPDAGLPPRIADRLREAVAVGDVTMLERIARDLRNAPGGSALAAQISALTREFDFDALKAFAERLPKEAVGNAN